MSFLWIGKFSTCDERLGKNDTDLEDACANTPWANLRAGRPMTLEDYPDCRHLLGFQFRPPQSD